MKPRLAVSILFILIASTFASDATAAFEKFRSWTGEVSSRCAMRVCHRLNRRRSARGNAVKSSDKYSATMIRLDGDHLQIGHDCATANPPCAVGTISPDGKTIVLSSPDAGLLSSNDGQTRRALLEFVRPSDHSRAFEFITTAAGQIHEVLDLTRIK